MSRLTLHPVPQLYHIHRRHVLHGYVHGHVNGHDGDNKRRVLRFQHPMVTDDGILHSTKLQC